MNGDYEAYREELERLQYQFEQAAAQWPGLFHHLLWTPYPVTEKEWATFIAANQSTDAWEKWDVFPDHGGCSRFIGNRAALDVFQRLASSTFLLLRAVHADGSVPDSGRISLPCNPGHHGWLQVLYETAGAFATPLLRLDYRLRNSPKNADAGELERLAYEWTMTSEGERFPSHPFVQTLAHDLSDRRQLPFSMSDN